MGEISLNWGGAATVALRTENRRRSAEPSSEGTGDGKG